MVQFPGLSEDLSSSVLTHLQLFIPNFCRENCKHTTTMVELTKDKHMHKFFHILVRHESIGPPCVLEVIVGWLCALFYVAAQIQVHRVHVFTNIFGLVCVSNFTDWSRSLTSQFCLCSNKKNSNMKFSAGTLSLYRNVIPWWYWNVNLCAVYWWWQHILLFSVSWAGWSMQMLSRGGHIRGLSGWCDQIVSCCIDLFFTGHSGNTYCMQYLMCCHWLLVESLNVIPGGGKFITVLGR